MSVYMNAINAYTKAASNAGKASFQEPHALTFDDLLVQNIENDKKSTSTGFMGYISNKISEISTSLRSAERLSDLAVNKKASLTEVVTTLNEADTLLQAAISIRDKAISAYQDIIKMQI